MSFFIEAASVELTHQLYNWLILRLIMCENMPDSQIGVRYLKWRFQALNLKLDKNWNFLCFHDSNAKLQVHLTVQWHVRCLIACSLVRAFMIVTTLIARSADCFSSIQAFCNQISWNIALVCSMNLSMRIEVEAVTEIQTEWTLLQLSNSLSKSEAKALTD